MLKETMMLSENDVVPSAAPTSLLLSASEATLFEGLKDNLPQGWTLDFKADAEMAGVAFVDCAEAPGSLPLFTVCRWADQLGALVQWMDGAASSAVASETLEPIMDLIPSGIFGFAETRLSTVRAEAWADTKH